MIPLVRWLLACLVWAVQRAGYWVRPYDPSLDARRWRWQPPGCMHVPDIELAECAQAEAGQAHAPHLTDGGTRLCPGCKW